MKTQRNHTQNAMDIDIADRLNKRQARHLHHELANALNERKKRLKAAVKDVEGIIATLAENKDMHSDILNDMQGHLATLHGALSYTLDLYSLWDSNRVSVDNYSRGDCIV